MATISQWQKIGYIAQGTNSEVLTIALGTGTTKKSYAIVDLKDLAFVLEKKGRVCDILAKVTAEIIED